jgi:glycosyltransferase involved in cell wall biosynthesis
MKLIFDCTPLANWIGHPTGIQRVVIETGSRLCSLLQSASLGLFDGAGRCLTYNLTTRSTGQVIEVEKGDVIIAAGSNWDFPGHQSNLMALQTRGVKIVTLFYDIIPMIMPFTYGPGFSEIYKNWFLEALGASDLAFCISENTRQDIIGYAKSHELSCSGVHVVRLGDELPSPGESPSLRIVNQTDTPYILSVGTLEYRKNHILLLNAYRYMHDALGYRPPRLLIVGKKGWLDHDIEYQVENDPRLSGLISILQGVTDADLHHLYVNSMFTVYPSFYEGWGLPVAESLCFGKPCIASGSSSMLEIAPGLVKHADPFLLQEWVAAIRDFADSPDVLMQATEAVRVGYQRVDWSVTANSMRDVLLERYPALRGE